LDVSHLSIRFEGDNGPALAVSDLSFQVRAGERLGIAGESGSGKSVTAQALLGLLNGATVEGEVKFQGEDVLTMAPEKLRSLRGWEMSYIFQDPLSAMDPVRTVGDQVSQVLRLRGINRKEAKERTIDMLDQVGIRNPEARFGDFPHQFSGGMRQRAMIAMALIGDPVLVIADEPTTALDVRVQAQVIDLLHRLTEERGVAVVFITHDLAIMAGFAQRMMVMYGGRIVESGMTDDVYYGSTHPYTLGLLNSLPRVMGKIAKELLTIGGQPPAPTNLPSGCAFNPRCKYVLDQCRVDVPELAIPAGGNHLSRCHRSEWLADNRGELT
jgi:oligopeptide/dipeptide ABC transporter ATP-binding protein